MIHFCVVCDTHLDVVLAYFFLVPECLQLPDVYKRGAEVPQGRVDRGDAGGRPIGEADSDVHHFLENNVVPKAKRKHKTGKVCQVVKL